MVLNNLNDAIMREAAHSFVTVSRLRLRYVT